MGGEINSLRSDKFPLFFHFSHRITGWLQAERPNWLATHRQGTEMERWSRVFAIALKSQRTTITMPQASHPRQCEASRKKNSAYESPLVTCSNRIKKGNLSERSEFVSLPDLSTAPTGTPRSGAANRGRLSLLTFFGEAKKVSGCRAAPGNVVRRKKNRSYQKPPSALPNPKLTEMSYFRQPPVDLPSIK